MVDELAHQRRTSRFFADYGMLLILLLLCLFFSIMTIREQYPTGEQAARKLADTLIKTTPQNKTILIISRGTGEDILFANGLKDLLAANKFLSVVAISGDPSEIRSSLTSMLDSSKAIGIIATTQSFAPVVQNITAQFKQTANVTILTPPSYKWPTFLLADNLRNVANQIAVIAIMAIGMTMVIITAGIDLSVGSLIALSAVLTTWLVGQAGGEHSSTAGLIAAGFGGMLICCAIGAFSGLMITRFNIPPFIATLAMMQVAAGLAYVISQGKPIYHLPENFIFLGRGVEPFLQIPYAVLLMVLLYIAAHIVMTRTTMGRYIYAVGGNIEAARLAGIRTKLILFFVYSLCGFLAGLSGVVMASQLKSGAPTYGLSYELYVIAAVVVGGTSLSGGEGRIFGTFIGAFIISVIQNGMNLTNVESYTQKIVLGLVILGAVLLDRLKQQGFKLKKSRSSN
jgi:ribose transport system permease protein